MFASFLACEIRLMAAPAAFRKYSTPGRSGAHLFARIRRQPGCGLPLGLPLGPHQGDAVPRRHRSGQ